MEVSNIKYMTLIIYTRKGRKCILLEDVTGYLCGGNIGCIIEGADFWPERITKTMKRT
jgi:hypothetical protein